MMKNQKKTLTGEELILFDRDEKVFTHKIIRKIEVKSLILEV